MRVCASLLETVRESRRSPTPLVGFYACAYQSPNNHHFTFVVALPIDQLLYEQGLEDGHFHCMMANTSWIGAGEWGAGLERSPLYL